MKMRINNGNENTTYRTLTSLIFTLELTLLIIQNIIRYPNINIEILIVIDVIKKNKKTESIIRPAKIIMAFISFFLFIVLSNFN